MPSVSPADHFGDVSSWKPSLFSQSDIVRIIEVARKYDQPEGTPITRIPEYTTPGGPNTYHCSKVDTAWTQGFFPGLLWLLVEREALSPGTLSAAGYDVDEVIRLARKYQSSFRHLARYAINHDQGFRFQLSYGRDLECTGNADAIPVIMEAADSLVDRYDAKVGCIRSWDIMIKKGKPDMWRRDNIDEHYLVIIDNMMNLDLLYLATELSGDQKYADIATTQARRMAECHVRENGTTYHVVDFQKQPPLGMTAQGYDDESCWARGQSWAIYGFAQVAQRTGEDEFITTCRKVADAFLERLPTNGVPPWDFDAPKPCPYDASAAMVAARGMQMLSQLLATSDLTASSYYFTAAIKLIRDTLRECAAPPATVENGVVNWGEEGWETILKHSTINGHRHARRQIMDHGLVYADYYFVEVANEILKMAATKAGVKSSVTAAVNIASGMLPASAVSGYADGAVASPLSAAVKAQ